jgi:hypothetical protein
MEGSLGNLMQFHRDHHQRILDEFSEISEEELHLGSKYWEEEEMSLRFRLHRFDSHMQQPTIQVEKALSEFGQVPNEAERLMRLLYGTLAHCENKTIGLPEVGEALRREVVNSMRARMDEIWSVLQLN